MRMTCRLSLCCVLLAPPTFAATNALQRCEDAEGNVSFTTLGCPIDQASTNIKAFAPLPGSVAAALPEPQQRSPNTPAQGEPVVVGQRDDGCGNVLTAERRRQANLNNRILPGMTVQEVENMLGRPARTVLRNGELRYQYQDKKKKLSHTITFDANGCVKGKP
jgi:hypothetical protein